MAILGTPSACSVFLLWTFSSSTRSPGMLLHVAFLLNCRQLLVFPSLVTSCGGDPIGVCILSSAAALRGGLMLSPFWVCFSQLCLSFSLVVFHMLCHAHVSPPDPFMAAADSSGSSVPLDALLVNPETFGGQSFRYSTCTFQALKTGRRTESSDAGTGRVGSTPGVF